MGRNTPKTRKVEPHIEPDDSQLDRVEQAKKQKTQQRLDTAVRNTMDYTRAAFRSLSTEFECGNATLDRERIIRNAIKLRDQAQNLINAADAKVA